MSTRAWMMAAGALLFVSATDAAAQSSIGIGPRVTFVRGGESPDGSQRFSGGALRMGSGRTAIELAMDYRSATTGDLTERITDYPIQASLLLYPVRARIAPYVVGGVGWYSQNVKRFTTAGTTLLDDETTRKMGYHAGFGGELRVHRRVGFHGDYRYTFIRFGNDDQTAAAGGTSSTPRWIPFAERLKLSHQGSMFTWGATFYF